MYTPRSFELTDLSSQHAVIHNYPLGTLVVQGNDGLCATHLPFLLDATSHPLGLLQAHVAKSNAEFSSLLDETPILAIFQGPHAYISPSWYPTKVSTGGKAVPTWNYVSVHVHGTLSIKSGPEWLLAHLEQQTSRYEQGRPDPWSINDAPADYMKTMLDHIVGLEITITRIEAKEKLSQNRPGIDQQGVIQGLNDPLQPVIGSVFNREIARLMQEKLKT